ncbi:MAG TPA: hypothetical protein VFL59_14815, partial [Candidatus Nanopelagicales bacterium]|nr:hypothetical protein [Candidatus Nanopelagicales bacterium]
MGRLRAALATIDQALGSLDGLEAAKARTNRALILHRSGRHREAMDEYAAALPVIRRAKDGRSERLLRGNRAQLSAEQGDIASAVADMEWSRRYALEQGRTIDAADDLWNLAALHALAGDLPRALELFDRADAEWGDVDRPQRFTARAEVLLEAGLAADAAELASDGIRWAQAHGWMYAEAEARLWLALASLTLPSPDLVRAEQEARAAVTAFAHQGRPDWQVLAQHAELVVRIRRSGRPADLDRAVEVASLLRDRGRDAHAADLRVAAGRRALAQGDIARARTMLGPLANQSTSRQIEVRSRAWYARALLQTIGSEAGASASLVRAWRLAEEQTALRGATELRAASASHASDIVATGCGLAVRERNVLRAFAWAERGRSSSLRRPVVRAPQDPELASALARLRWSAMLDENALQDGDVDLAFRARRRRDEAEVRRLSLRARGGGRAERVATVTDIRRCAEHRALVELLQHDARYWAVRVDASGAELLPLAPVGEIGQHVDTLVFALRRLLATPPGPGRDRMRGTLDSAREQLRTLVIEPLGTAEGTALVVSPVGHLCQLPWGALDQCCGGITVAPSATTWFRAQSEP